MPIREWRSEAAYAYLNDLKPAEFAWEFLRRNPEYQRDYRTAADATAADAESVIAQWGLRFRDRPGSSGEQRTGHLAAASQSRRRSRRASAGALQKRRSDRRAPTSIRAPRRRRRTLDHQ
jgi:transcriptional regulator